MLFIASACRAALHFLLFLCGVRVSPTQLSYSPVTITTIRDGTLFFGGFLWSSTEEEASNTVTMIIPKFWTTDTV